MRTYNNKILISVLAVLVIAFALSRIFRAPGLESNMRKKLIDLDTAAITEIRIVRPKKPEQEIKLVAQEKGSAWKVVSAEKQAMASEEGVRDALRTAGEIQIENMVSRKKKKWNVFDVGDSSGIKVTLYVGEDKQADFRIGRIGFSQDAQKTMLTYVRVANEDEVYSTKAFLTAYFDKKFDDWRDKTLIRLSKEDVTEVAFNYPDSGFVLTKKDTLWYLNNKSLGLSKVEAYLNKLKRRDMTDFNDFFTPSADSSSLEIQVTGGKKTLAVLRAWPTGGESWAISSSSQKGVYFADREGKTVKDLFVGRATFSD